MSSDAAAKLLANVRADSELQAKLGPNPSVESYMDEARRQGLEFSIDELRGVINAEQFYQKASNDPVLFKRVSRQNEDGVVAVAAEEGFPCRLEDLQAVLRPHQTPSDELSDEDLEKVAGGMILQGGSYVKVRVAKTPAPPAPFVPVPYPDMEAIESDAEDAKVDVVDPAEFVKEDVLEPAARFTQDAREWTVDKTEEGARAAKEQVPDPVVDVVEEGTGYVNETVLDPVVEAAEEMAEDIEETVKQQAEDAEETGEGFAEAVGNVVEGTTGGGDSGDDDGGIVDDIVEAAEDVADAAEDAAEDARDAVEDTNEEFNDTVKSMLDNV